MWRAHAGLIGTLGFTGVTWIDSISFPDWVTAVAALLTAAFAAYHYYWAAQERKLNVKIKRGQHKES